MNSVILLEKQKCSLCFKGIQYHFSYYKHPEYSISRLFKVYGRINVSTSPPLICNAYSLTIDIKKRDAKSGNKVAVVSLQC